MSIHHQDSAGIIAQPVVKELQPLFQQPAEIKG